MDVNNKKTKIASYPYCRIPRGYFDRQIKALNKVNTRSIKNFKRNLLSVVSIDGRPVLSVLV